MKVTKRIEEYIIDSVHQKYADYYRKIEEPRKQMNTEIELAKDELTKYVRQQMLSILSKYFDKEFLANEVERYYVTRDYYSSRGKTCDRVQEKLDQLRQKEEKDINSILLELEFNGTKEKLDELIEAINPEE